MSLTLLSNRMDGLPENDELTDAMDDVWYNMPAEDTDDIAGELRALNFLSVAIGFRAEIEKLKEERLARDNN